MGPPICKILVVKSMLSLFGQLRWDPEVLVSKSPWIRLRCEPRRMQFPDESSDVSSLGGSVTADITRPPAVVNMIAFSDLYQYREHGELLRF